MADEKPEVTTEVSNHQTQQAAVTMTVAEGKEAVADKGPSAESLGVTQSQFDKYYSKDTGKYNWEAHAKEQEYIKKQQEDKTPEEKAEGDDKKTEDAEEETKYSEITDDNAPAAIRDAGLDIETLKAKVVETGDIDDADYEALKKIGVSEAAANAYVQGLFDRAQSHLNEIMEMFGGADGLKGTVNKLVEAGALSKEDLSGLSYALGDPRNGKAVAKALLAQAGVKPADPVKLRGEQKVSAQETTGFKSQAEMIAAMRDPRYKKDPAYRADVMEKVKGASFNDVSKLHTSGL